MPKLQCDPMEIHTECSFIFSIENNLRSLDCYGRKGKTVTVPEETWIGELEGLITTVTFPSCYIKVPSI